MKKEKLNMKKNHFLLLLCILILINCGGNRTVKSTAKPTPPIATSKPAPTPAPTTNKPVSPPSTTTPPDAIGDNSKKPGGYYLDDGPDVNPPQDLDNILDATPKNEPLLARANKPYKALGAIYTPMTTSQSYKERGIASWYGKRFHGKKTSSGEIYDMYAMTAAHTTLPLPSYAKVTNPANGRSVIVRINDRGPFKSTRIIDLSYAAAYKLRLINQGSGLVEVEAIHPDQNTNVTTTVATTDSAESSAPQTTTDTPAIPSSTTSPPVSEVTQAAVTKPIEIKQANQVPQSPNADNPVIAEYFIQAGAFKSEANAEALLRKIQGLDIEQNVGINHVYNNGLHRLKLGPYDTKQGAEQVAANIRKQLNIATIITNQ